MVKESWLNTIKNNIYVLLAFSIPMPFVLGPLVILSLLYILLISGDLRFNWQRLKERKLFWPWFIYFIFFAISISYSHNTTQSFFDIQQKLSLVLFPFIIGCGMPISRMQMEKIFIGFISSISLIALFSISRGLYIFINHHTFSQFFYHALVRKLDANAVYFAWYTLLSISLLIFWQWETFFINKNIYIKHFIFLLHIIFFLLLSARTLILIFTILVLPVYVFKQMKNIRKTIFKLSLLLIITFVIIIIGKTENPIKERYIQLFDNKAKVYTPRFILWNNSIEILNEQHIWLRGTGNGDVQFYLNKKVDNHVKYHAEAKYSWRDLYHINCHNMYLQTVLMVGILGLIPLVFMVFAPFYKINETNLGFAYIIFLVSSSIFMFQESIFQSQGGILYYTFFSMIFWNYRLTERNNRKLTVNVFKKT
jgi:O-antigen ligase